GSNLGPTSKALVDRVKDDVQKLGLPVGTEIPADLVTASGSGLDPDISPAAAALQVPRVARARDLPTGEVERLVAAATTPRELGVLGEPHVNVLKLNLALDSLARR
ncbi:MAG: potassium-transporting ATPase subunit C, partial [Alphaproteobacteria bacterium]|nr:potassium-transporting ATPase subunit C [Alphaproteobacteria bacterium]